jgi:hypothetical protein
MGTIMSKESINQNYLIIENNIVINVCVWNGDTSQWKPELGSIAIIQSTTPAITWEFNTSLNDYELIEVMGAAQIGFTWNGTVCTTNQSKPIFAITKIDQPSTIGTQTA